MARNLPRFSNRPELARIMLINLPDLGGAPPEQRVRQGWWRRKWEDGTPDVSQAPCRNPRGARNAVCWWSWPRPCCGSSPSGRATTTSTNHQGCLAFTRSRPSARPSSTTRRQWTIFCRLLFPKHKIWILRNSPSWFRPSLGCHIASGVLQTPRLLLFSCWRACAGKPDEWACRIPWFEARPG